MSADSERIWQAILFFNWLWVGPVTVIIAMTLLVKTTGLAAVIAVICMLIINVIQHKVGKLVGKMRRKLVIFTEQRIKITNEVLQGIRIIKLYSWEEPTLERITKLREKEVEYVTKYQLARMINTALMFLGPVLISFTLFLSFILLEGVLTVPLVYECYALLNIIRYGLFNTSVLYLYLVSLSNYLII